MNSVFVCDFISRSIRSMDLYEIRQKRELLLSLKMPHNRTTSFPWERSKFFLIFVSYFYLNLNYFDYVQQLFLLLYIPKNGFHIKLRTCSFHHASFTNSFVEIPQRFSSYSYRKKKFNWSNFRQRELFPQCVLQSDRGKKLQSFHSSS